MKNTILKFIISRSGAIITPIAAAIIAAIAIKIDPFSHELAEQLKGPEVIGWLTAFIIAVISAWANGKQREGIKDIQKSLIEVGKIDVHKDGVAGPVTRTSQREILGLKVENKESKKIKEKRNFLQKLWPLNLVR